MKANKELLHALSETTEVHSMPRKLNGMREAMMRAPWRAMACRDGAKYGDGK